MSPVTYNLNYQNIEKFMEVRIMENTTAKVSLFARG